MAILILLVTCYIVLLLNKQLSEVQRTERARD